MVKYMKLTDVRIKFREIESGYVQYKIEYDDEAEEWMLIEKLNPTLTKVKRFDDIRVIIDLLYLRFKYAPRVEVFGDSNDWDNVDNERAEYDVCVNGCVITHTWKAWHDIVHAYLDEFDVN